MRPKPPPEAEKGRVSTGPLASTPEYQNNGLFILTCPLTRTKLRLIVSDGAGWDHVSISLNNVMAMPKNLRRCPTWEEMCWVKDLFWDEEETVLQYHPPKTCYVNTHPYTLHLFKSQHAYIPLPPGALVGIPGLNYRED